MILAIVGYAFYSKHWAFFGLAGVFVILTGAMLAAGEPIEYATGTFTIVEGFAGDSNMTRFVPDFNAITTTTSVPAWMWSQVMMYGGFVFIILAFVLAMRGIMDRREVEYP